MKKILISLFLLLLLVNNSLGIKKKLARRYNINDPELIYTSKGTIRGIIKNSHRVFYGIPFARPPINNLRWENPIEPKSWNHIKNTNQQKAQCPQLCSSDTKVITSEDCLYLDVFTPRDINPASKLPVLVYIPPDNNCETLETYDGSKFAKSSVVFVKINYRLGVFGFLGTDLIEGNFGILDQIKALEWVNENIEAFGGNKDKVTIWGGESIAIHLTSSYSKHYFHSAILSSTSLTNVVLNNKSKARGYANRLIIKIGVCSNIEDIDCLRSLSTDQLLEAQEKVKLQLLGSKVLERFTVWSPIIDGDIVPIQPLEAVKNGKIHNVPIIIGSVHDEAMEFVYKLFENGTLGLNSNLSFKKRISPNYYSIYLSLIFPLSWKKVLDKYPVPQGNQDVRPILSRIINDYLFSCSNKYFINHFTTQNSDSKIYHYNFNHIKSIKPIRSLFSISKSTQIKSCETHSCHGSDITLFLGSYEMVSDYTDYDEIKISNYLTTFITNFVKTHNPNFGSSDNVYSEDDHYNEVPVYWQPVSQFKNTTLIINNDLELKDNISNSKCDLFNNINLK